MLQPERSSPAAAARRTFTKDGKEKCQQRFNPPAIRQCELKEPGQKASHNAEVALQSTVISRLR